MGLLDFIVKPAEDAINSVKNKVENTVSQGVKNFQSSPMESALTGNFSQVLPRIQSDVSTLGKEASTGNLGPLSGMMGVDAAGEELPTGTKMVNTGVTGDAKMQAQLPKINPQILDAKGNPVKSTTDYPTQTDLKAGAETFGNPQPKPQAPQPQTAPKEALPGGDSRDIPRSAVNIMNSIYTVPAKRSTADLKTLGTYKDMLTHVKAGTDPALLEQMPDLLSGGDGVVSQMVREATQQINHPISLGNPVEAAKNILNARKTFTNADTRNDILSDIAQAAPTPKGNPGEFDPMDALQYARDLEAFARQTRGKSTYLTTRGDKEVIANAYDAAADEVMSQIDQGAKGVSVEGVKTPQRMQFLQQFFPRIASKIKNAQDVSGMRSSIGDVTRFGKIIQQNEGQSTSAFGKVAAGMQRDLGQFGYNLVTNPQGTLLKEAINKGAQFVNRTPNQRDQLMKALEGNAADDEGPFGKAPNTDATSATMTQPSSKKGDILKTVAGIGGVGAILAGAHMADQHGNIPSNAAGANPTNQNQNTHGGSMTQFDTNVNSPATIPQSANDLKQNADGTYGIADIFSWKDPTSGNALFKSPAVIKQETDQLAAIEGNPAYSSSTVLQAQARQLQTQIAADQQLSGAVTQSYQKYLGQNNLFSKTIQDAAKSSINIANYNGSYNDLLNHVKNTNAALYQDLTNLESAGLVNPNVPISGTLTSALQAGAANNLMQFYGFLSSQVGYQGAGSAGGVTPAVGGVQAAPAAPSSATPPPNINYSKGLPGGGNTPLPAIPNFAQMGAQFAQ